MIVEKIPEEKEPEVSKIVEIPKEQVELEKRYFTVYMSFYGLIRSLVLKLRKSGRTWRVIPTRRRWKISI